MEGPTPVSALIHAATMVTAGVYLLVRLHPIYEAAEFVQHFAAGIGAVTLLVAGLIALVQTDIKRVIAYSTMSQIGYMFLAAGIGAYGNAMFHLMTHAFFKALLFLAAGIVIHALAGEQDIRKMGGLRDALPRTYLFMLIGSLALAGIFPFAGFWSKDSILASALASGTYGFVLFVAGLIGAFLTGLYTFRMIFLVWRGDRSPYVARAPARHEPRRGAVLDVGHGRGARRALRHRRLGPDRRGSGTRSRTGWHPSPSRSSSRACTQDWVTSSIAMALALGGIYLAWLFYGERSRAVPSYPTARRVLEHKLYFDELYDAVFYRPAVAIANALRRGVEEPLVEGSIDGAAASVREAGRTATLVQTGYLRSYALALTAGLAVLAVLFVALR